MNVGRDFKKAVEHAKDNTRLDGQPRYLHMYGGVLWLSKTAPTCGHWMVTPDGEVINVEE